MTSNNTPAPLVITNNTGETFIQADAVDHFNRTIANALRFTTAATVQRVEVFINPRGVWVSTPEWLEHQIRVVYVNEERSVLSIAAIQRAPGADTEFCS